MFDRLKRLWQPRLYTHNRIDISQQRILANLTHLQSLQPEHAIFPVLKANAYGHGLQQMCTILDTTDVPFLCVDSYPEFQFVQKYSSKKALVIGETDPRNYRHYHPRTASIAVYNIATLKALIQQGRKQHIHLFLNTGMNREGIQFRELDMAIKLFQQSPDLLVLEGVMSHFANADEVAYNFCHTQVDHFKKMYALLEEAGLSARWKHIGNSAGIARVRDSFFTAWRSGLAMYGYAPLTEDDPGYSMFAPLQPALRICSTVVSVQALTAGDIVGYGGSYTARDEEQIATIPFGYHEGLDRKLSNHRSILRGDHALPLVGTICMNLSSFVTQGHPVQLGDNVTVVSRDPTAPNTVMQFAHQTQTIPYEVLVNLNPKVRRTIV